MQVAQTLKDKLLGIEGKRSRKKKKLKKRKDAQMGIDREIADQGGQHDREAVGADHRTRRPQLYPP
jgi:hypothetical protein